LVVASKAPGVATMWPRSKLGRHGTRMVVIMVFSPVFNGCAIAADAHRETTAHKEGGDALHRRLPPDKFARASARSRATASAEFGGFRDFRDGVKVASLRLPMDAAARGKRRDG
jgi:hypothetical protein